MPGENCTFVGYQNEGGINALLARLAGLGTDRFFALAVIWSRFGWPLRIKNGQPIGFSVDQVQPFTYRMRQ